MKDITLNDIAFNKVARELLTCMNDMEALAKLKNLANGVNEWSRKSYQLGDSVNSENLQGLGYFLQLASTPEELSKVVIRTEKRIAELKILANAYLRGQDIVALKLRS